MNLADLSILLIEPSNAAKNYFNAPKRRGAYYDYRRQSQ